MGLNRLKWLSIIVPAVILVAFDYLRNFVFPYAFFYGWSGLLLVWMLAIVGTAVFSHGMFTLIARMEREVLQRNKELAATADITVALGQPLKLDEILNVALYTVLQIMRAEGGSICVLDEAKRELVLMAHLGLPSELLGPLHRAKLSDDSIGNQVVETGKPLVITNLWEDPRIAEPARQCGFRSAVSVPMKAEGKVMGALALVSAKERSFSPSEVALLTNLSGQLGMAVRHAHLAEHLLRRNRELAILEERERIAREMHDGMGQILGYVNTKTQAIRRLLALGQATEAEQALEQLEEASRKVYADTREAIVGLRTTATSSGGLVPALKEYLEWFGRQNAIETELILGDVGDGSLDATVEIQLIRIVQEALSNVRKHANAHKASVSLYTFDGRLRLAVQDDGQGFSPEHIARGAWPQFGLQAMRERAESVGGTFEVSSVPSQGARISVVVPNGDRPR